ncbi:DEK domain-containing chromatin-associated protein 4-like [Cryptomeria japonica]|uniref:DEK domain-containing chromatin-associated protein 4-like n=1 Tax=Cryptomeria japonica TaxID=3369 RepID=UPI0027DA92AA|nr:DEK domain-containing chromatin-associated protein 4-like [Cryptomeria japonica]
MGYEVEAKIIKVYANMLLSKLVDRKAKRFGTCEEASFKIKRELNEPIIQKRVNNMIDTLDKKYGGEASGATASTGTSEQTWAKSNKDEEQTRENKKMSKAKPKGTASSKPTTYTKENDSDTPTSSPIKGKWKTTLAIEKEHGIKPLMKVQHDLDFDQASPVVEACIQHFKIRNRIGRVVVGEIEVVHEEGVALWKTIMSQQKEAEEEIAKRTKQDQGATAFDKEKGKEKDSAEGFDVFTIEDIIGNVVLDIPNLTKDVEQPVKPKSTVDIDVTPKKGAEEENKVESKKSVVDTPLVKRKLDLEKESEKKKAKLTTTASSEVEAEEKEEEIEEEEEEDSVIGI